MEHRGRRSGLELTCLGVVVVDAVALIVQIHLQQNRNDLAVKEVTAARRWAQDSILVNMAESWVGLRMVRLSYMHFCGDKILTCVCLRIQGGDKYQQAFYVFEELAQAPSTSSVQTLVAQAVAELHLGRTEEAQAALDQAMKKDPTYAEAIANALVLQVIIGKDPQELIEYVPSMTSHLWRGPMLIRICCSRSLKKTAPKHAFLTDLEQKSQLFDTAASKFSAKIAA